MELADLSRVMREARRSAFRLETLPQYLVPQEEAEFAAWRAGTPFPQRNPDEVPWMSAVKARAAQGFRRYRVHIIDHPMSDYTRFELHGYLENQAIGEEINIADRRDHNELRDLHEDFWLIDDEVVVRMVYDAEGHFLHPEGVAEVAPYVEIRDIAMRCAEPLDDYLARNQLQLEA